MRLSTTPFGRHGRDGQLDGPLVVGGAGPVLGDGGGDQVLEQGGLAGAAVADEHDVAQLLRPGGDGDGTEDAAWRS